MPRIVFLSPNPPSFYGGVERFVFYLAKELANGYEVLTIDGTALGSSFRNNLAKIAGKVSPLAYEALSTYLISHHPKLREEDGDTSIVISNGHCGWALGTGYRNAINVHHGTAFGFRRALSQFGKAQHGLILNEWLEKQSALGKCVVAVSQNTRDELESHYKLKVDLVIENGVDTDFFKPLDNKASCRRSFNLPASKFLGLFVGTNELRKGVDVVMKVSAELPQGTAIVALSNRNILLPNIINLRNVDFYNLPSLYSAVDFFLFPSRYEGCSFSILESMSCGLPLIASNVGHLSRIKKESPHLAEFIVDGHDPREYLKRIKMLEESNNLRSEMRAQVREEILKTNTLERFVQNYRHLVQSMMAQQL